MRSTVNPAADECLLDVVDRARTIGDVDELELDPARHAGQLLHRALRHERAVVEGDDVIAHPLHLLEHVRRQHHVDAELAIDLADDVEHLVALHRVEPVGRFVEHDELRVGGDRLGELHPLPLAGRHRAEGAEPLLAEPDQVQRVAGAARAPRRAGRPFTSARWRTKS